MSAAIFTLAALLARLGAAGVIRWVLITVVTFMALVTKDLGRRTTAMAILKLIVPANAAPNSTAGCGGPCAAHAGQHQGS